MKFGQSKLVTLGHVDRQTDGQVYYKISKLQCWFGQNIVKTPYGQ